MRVKTQCVGYVLMAALTMGSHGIAGETEQAPKPGKPAARPAPPPMEELILTGTLTKVEALEEKPVDDLEAAPEDPMPIETEMKDGNDAW
jgi:hypothetical protein